jgi:hypothetical protein
MEKKIKGEVRWNSHWKRFQVVVDGTIYEEFRDFDEALDNLERSGFKNIKVTTESLKLKEIVRQIVKENKIINDKFPNYEIVQVNPMDFDDPDYKIMKKNEHKSKMIADNNFTLVYFADIPNKVVRFYKKKKMSKI